MYTGPNIIRDGLVLHLDAANIKSFRGEPTINLYGDMSTSDALRTPRIEYNTNNWTAPFIVPPENIGRVYVHTSGSLTSTWSGNEYGYTLKAYSYTSGLTYTLSCWVYLSENCDIDYMNCSMENTTIIESTHQGYDFTKMGTWQQISLKCNSAANVENGNAIPIYPAKLGITDGSFAGFYAWGGAQLEQKDHITFYTEDSRGSTVATGGGWKDLSLNNNHGELVEGITYISNIPSLYFDASEEIIKTNITSFGNNMTWCAWINCSSNVTPYNMFMGSLLPYFCFFDGNRLYFSNNIGGTQQTIATASNLELNKWYYAVFTTSYDGVNTTMKIYTNGSETQSQSFSGFQNNSGYNFYIGDGRDTNWYRFNGKVSNVSIYNRTLSISEISQNYNVLKSRFGL